MISIHRVPLFLIGSLISLLLFCSFGAFMNRMSEKHDRRIESVKRQSNFASERLDSTQKEVIAQRNRADSLQVIIEVQRREEILWMARALYSETKRPHEMWHVGWVIRNRYESRFRGETYKDVILHPKQFSAFNRGSPMRDYYLRLQPEDVGEAPRWHAALATAKRVIDSPPIFRPFPKDTYHFYSRRSMSGEPYWKNRLDPVAVSSIDANRFNFLRGKTSTTVASTAR
jgi:hypothetical protein